MTSLDSPVLAVTPGPHEADALAADVASFLGDEAAAVLSGLAGVVTFDHDPGRLSAAFVWERIQRILLRPVNPGDLVLTTHPEQIAVLRYYLGLDVREIAEHLDIAEGTVKAMLFRARRRLRSLLGCDGESKMGEQ